MNHGNETFLGLRFQPSHPDLDPHSVPVSTLIGVLHGLQETVHLVATMEAEPGDGGWRPVSREVKERYQLRWRPPVEGCVYQPVIFADQKRDHFGVDDLPRVFESIKRLMDSIMTNDERAFGRRVENSAYRLPILESLGKVFKNVGGQYHLTIEDEIGHAIADSKSASNTISWLKKRIKNYEKRENFTLPVFTGYLDKIDFGNLEVSLLTPGTLRPLKCNYPKEFEKILLENVRKLIQIEGDVEMDRDEKPIKIVLAEKIHPVDTSDVKVIEVLPEYLEILKLENSHVEICLSESKQTYFAEHKELDINLAADTRSELLDGIKEDIEYLWRSYALEDDEKLSSGALNLKKNLKRCLRENYR